MDIVVHTEGQTEAEIITVEDTAIIGLSSPRGQDCASGSPSRSRRSDSTRTFAEVGIKPHHHIHRGHCHTLHADVRHETEHKQHDVRPSATIGEVREWR